MLRKQKIRKRREKKKIQKRSFLQKSKARVLLNAIVFIIILII
jgi:hypothetical protein